MTEPEIVKGVRGVHRISVRICKRNDAAAISRARAEARLREIRGRANAGAGDRDKF